MWRYDAGRTAASPYALPDSVRLLWMHEYTPREPTWDDPLNRDLMRFDEIFEPVVAERKVIIPFNDEDRIAALSARTGVEIWSFYADGPVRLAPAIYNGKVYFGSDDGYVYCLRLDDGSLVWRFHAAPRDRKLLGNKRLISAWPVRGGVVVKDGIVYFSAGIWPMMGTFIYAVDAETGNIIWLNDGTGCQFTIQPHGAPSFAGIAPEGCFAISSDTLLIPGGRSVPAAFDLQTGKQLYYHLADQNKTGGDFVAASGDIFFHHHREKMTTMCALSDGSRLVGQIGNQPVLTSEVFYFSGDSVTALDVAKLKKNFGNPSAAQLWKIEVNASEDLIKAGNSLYAGGNDVITAITLPADKDRLPQIAWKKRITGTVKRLVAAEKKLFVVTREGTIMAFGKGVSTKDIHVIPPAVIEEPEDVLAKAQKLLNESDNPSGGYALWYGVKNSSLIKALIDISDLHLIVINKDARIIGELRKEFTGSHLLGKRLSFLCGTLDSFHLNPYFASLVIVSGKDITENPKALDVVYNALRPYDGTALILSTKITLAPKEGYTIKKLKNGWKIQRKGPLKGAGTWTHQYGNICNTTNSGDQIVKPPFGVLWFGGVSNLDVLPRHGHGPPEQVLGGRLFIEGIDELSARDVYTGRVLWKKRLLDLGNYGVYYDGTYRDSPTSTRYNQVHLPGANVRGTNFVVAPDAVYVIEQSWCDVLDPATGRQINRIALPPVNPTAKRPKAPPWSFIGVYKDYLIGGYGFVDFTDLLGIKKADYSKKTDYDRAASKDLIIFNRYTGEILWRLKSRFSFLNNAIVVGNDKLFCLDKLPPYVENQLIRRGELLPDSCRMLAVDIATGKKIWEKQEHVFGSFLIYSEEHDILVETTRPSRDMVLGETGKRMAAFKGEDGTLIWNYERSYPTFPILHNSQLIVEGQIYDLFTGKAVETLNPITGERMPWTWKRNHGCNYPIACENILTFRSGAAGFYNLGENGGTGSFGGFKSSCTSNLVVADGVVNAPDYTRTCSCSYQNQTSLALIHMDAGEAWTFNPYKKGTAPVKKIGLNFGAPGDHMGKDGMLWLDFPSEGGPSPDIPVQLNFNKIKWFRHHSARYILDGIPWVAASGLEGEGEMDITLGGDNGEVYSAYTVTLHFAEPEDIKEGERTFSVFLQGKPVLKDFDIVKNAGEIRKDVSITVKHIPVPDGHLHLRLEKNNHVSLAPILCGIALYAEEKTTA